MCERAEIMMGGFREWEYALGGHVDARLVLQQISSCDDANNPDCHTSSCHAHHKRGQPSIPHSRGTRTDHARLVES